MKLRLRQRCEFRAIFVPFVATSSGRLFVRSDDGFIYSAWFKSPSSRLSLNLTFLVLSALFQLCRSLSLGVQLGHSNRQLCVLGAAKCSVLSSRGGGGGGAACNRQDLGPRQLRRWARRLAQRSRRGSSRRTRSRIRWRSRSHGGGGGRRGGGGGGAGRPPAGP